MPVPKNKKLKVDRILLEKGIKLILYTGGVFNGLKLPSGAQLHINFQEVGSSLGMKKVIAETFNKARVGAISFGFSRKQVISMAKQMLKAMGS